MSVEFISCTPDPELLCVEVARVSSTRSDKKATPSKLISYLIKHDHWSPFEHAYMTLRITTSRAIAAQLIRHRSFTFQEFSQRYTDVRVGMEDEFQPVELRGQDSKNRQSSVEMTENPLLRLKINYHLNQSLALYGELIEDGVAKECARMVLPLCTTTFVLMTGNIRSWTHFIQSRMYAGAQKEIQDLAVQAKVYFDEYFPLVSKALLIKQA